MVGSAYVKQRTKGLGSKYYKVTKQLESSFRFVKGSVVSNFYGETNKTDKLIDYLNRLIEKTAAPSLSKSANKDKNYIASIFCNSQAHNPYKENIDWTRGRFKGDTLNIVVKNGLIIEKVFLTAQGNIIIIKRKDLGLFARLAIKN